VLCAIISIHDERADFLRTVVSCDGHRFDHGEWNNYRHKNAEFKEQQRSDKLEFVIHGITPFDALMGMFTAAAATSWLVLRSVIVGGVVEVFAIKEIDDRTTGRNKQDYGHEK
jgi:hypothetical protein